MVMRERKGEEIKKERGEVTIKLRYNANFGTYKLDFYTLEGVK